MQFQFGGKYQQVLKGFCWGKGNGGYKQKVGTAFQKSPMELFEHRHNDI